MTETQPWDPHGLLAEGSVHSDRYQLRRLLGQGGMAQVYLAQDMVLGRSVAVKVFRPGIGSLRDGKRQQQESGGEAHFHGSIVRDPRRRRSRGSRSS